MEPAIAPSLELRVRQRLQERKKRAMGAKGNTSQTVLTPDKRSLIIRGETLRTGPGLPLRALKGNGLEEGQTLESHKTRFLQVENNLEVLVMKRKKAVKTKSLTKI